MQAKTTVLAPSERADVCRSVVVGELPPIRVRVSTPGVDLSRLELTVLLYEWAVAGAEELLELSTEEVRQIVQEMLPWVGLRAIHQAAERITANGPEDLRAAAFWELCEMQIVDAFNLPHRDTYEYLDRRLPLSEAWQAFAAQRLSRTSDTAGSWRTVRRSVGRGHWSDLEALYPDAGYELWPAYEQAV